MTLEEGGRVNSNVGDLKAEIEEVEGAPRYRQELFMLVEGAENGSEEPLSDDFEIEEACTVELCVQPEEEWEWDASSELIKDKVFELSGPNNSIATKIDEDGDLGNCMVGRVVEVETSHHLYEAHARQCRYHIHLLRCGAQDAMKIIAQWAGSRTVAMGVFTATVKVMTTGLEGSSQDRC